MAYQVFESGKPADCYHRKLHPSWKQSRFETWSEAQEYANKYLGQYQVGILIPNIPIDYNGYGDTIEIREVE